MRRPSTIEALYLDFDGFFASVMQQADPRLRGKPIGVIPFATSKPRYTSVIACSREAKARGVKNVMRVQDALDICPEMVLVPQRPDLFRRAHDALLNEIACVIPIETIKSIDELACRLDARDVADPHGLAARIKARLREHIGPYITCSIGMAANRLLAKIACKIDKPDGVTVWAPEDMPDPLLALDLEDIPGVGSRMARRLRHAGIRTPADLLATHPKQLRALWRSVSGERLWYALHGHAYQTPATERGMFGHARVLPPAWRDIDHAVLMSRVLLTKAARRMRREGFHAGRLWLWLQAHADRWSGAQPLPSVNDDRACLAALTSLWTRVRREAGPRIRIVRVGVTLMDLTPAARRQGDLFLHDDAERRQWEILSHTMDDLNRRFGKRVLTLGPWMSPPGDYTGAKIAFTRIPDAEDFW